MPRQERKTDAKIAEELVEQSSKRIEGELREELALKQEELAQLIQNPVFEKFEKKKQLEDEIAKLRRAVEVSKRIQSSVKGAARKAVTPSRGCLGG